MEGHFYRKKMSEPHRQFGIKPRHLPEHQLPTNGDIIGRLLMVRIGLMEERSETDERKNSVELCMKQVASEVFALRRKASLPTRSEQCVLKEVRKLWMEKENVRKRGKRKEREPAKNVRVNMCSLFDISNRKREPELADDRAFLADQRRNRQLQIGGLDRSTTALWHRRSERTAKEAKRATAASITYENPQESAVSSGHSGSTAGTTSFPGH